MCLRSGALNIYVFNTTDGYDLSTKQPVFSRTGLQTGRRVWLEAAITINSTSVASNSTIALEVEGCTPDLYCDTALDDIELNEGQCPCK